MTAELGAVLVLVYLILGIIVGEIFDVWYDSTHAEATGEPTFVETIYATPRKPLAFGYAKLYFREVIVTPEAFEHYHWGIWLVANAVTAFTFFPPLAFLMIGLAASLILDENRRGLADKPFGVGKPYFAASALVGIILFVALFVRLAVISRPLEPLVEVVAFAVPFIVLLVYRGGQTR
jgi:hypothetical protein